MILIAYGAIACFQLLDGLNVLEPSQALFELRHVHCEPSLQVATNSLAPNASGEPPPHPPPSTGQKLYAGGGRLRRLVRQSMGRTWRLSLSYGAGIPTTWRISHWAFSNCATLSMHYRFMGSVVNGLFNCPLFVSV